MSKAESLISLSGVGLRRSGSWLVREVSFSIRQGEIVTLIGPNGAGKTTLAKLLVGLEKPTCGTITRRSKLQASYVPQRLALDRTLPLGVGRFISLTRRLSESQIAAVLARVGMAGSQNRPLHLLSGGQFQRVLIARALLGVPDLLILDEPLQNIDLRGQREIYHFIWNLNQTLGCAIFLISHDLHVVMARSNRILCLNQRLCCEGSLEALRRQPAYAHFVSRFGRPSDSPDAESLETPGEMPAPAVPRAPVGGEEDSAEAVFALYQHHHGQPHPQYQAHRPSPSGGPSGEGSPEDSSSASASGEKAGSDA